MKDLRYESLHNHTVISDGVLTHLEILEHSEKHSIGTVHFTDHDVLPNAEIMQQLRDYSGPVRWSMGIELSFGLPAEIPEWDKHSIHVNGLFIDPTNQALIDFCAGITLGRLDRMKRVVAHMQGLGFDISQDDCLAEAGESQLGQPHMVKALLRKPQNLTRMAELKSEMRQASEHDASIRAEYDKMEQAGARQEPYVLFMGSSSFFPLPKHKNTHSVGFDEGVKLIRDAGGVAIAAHPWVYRDRLTYPVLEQILADGRLDGIETENVNTFGSVGWDDAFPEMRRMTTATHTFSVVCCDTHDEADIAAFASSHLAEESVGQTAALIQKFHPNLSWGTIR